MIIFPLSLARSTHSFAYIFVFNITALFICLSKLLRQPNSAEPINWGDIDLDATINS